MARDAQRGRGFGLRQPFAVFLGRPVSADAVNPAQRADTMRGPGLALSGAHAHAVQRCRDLRVGPPRGHAADYGHRLLGRSAAVLAGFRFGEPQLRVLAAAPMDRQNDFARRLVDIGDDVGDQGPEQPLASPRGHSRCVPGGLKIVGKTGEIRHGGGRGGHRHGADPRLAGLDAPERRLPALFQLGGDQPVVGIAGGVASLRQRGLVARLLEVQFGHPPSFALVFHVSPLGFQRGLDRHRLHSPQKLAGNGRVDTGTAEAEASRLPQHLVRAFAPIHGLGWATPAVAHRQTPPTPRAAQHADQQRSTAATCLRAADPAMSVGGELRLIALELGPVHVTLVVILQQNLPLFKRLAVAIALPRPSFDDFGALLALSVGVVG